MESDEIVFKGANLFLRFKEALAEVVEDDLEQSFAFMRSILPEPPWSGGGLAKDLGIGLVGLEAVAFDITF